MLIHFHCTARDTQTIRLATENGVQFTDIVAARFIRPLHSATGNFSPRLSARLDVCIEEIP